VEGRGRGRGTGEGDGDQGQGRVWGRVAGSGGAAALSTVAICLTHAHSLDTCSVAAPPWCSPE